MVIHSSLTGATNENHVKAVGADAHVAKFARGNWPLRSRRTRPALIPHGDHHIQRQQVRSISELMFDAVGLSFNDSKKSLRPVPPCAAHPENGARWFFRLHRTVAG